MKNLKTICASAFALGLCLAVPPAMAQQDQDQQDQGAHHGGHNDNNNDHAGHHGDGGGGGGNDNDNHHGGHGGNNDNNDNGHHAGNGGGNDNNHHAGGNNNHDRTVNVHRNVTVHRTVTVDKVVRDRINRRPDVIKIRANIHAPRRFHWKVYVHPAGWYTHRWAYNEVLPVTFYASDYWINDYGSFGLVLPPPGFVWVRVGNDALLIDRESGLIVRVEYEVFY